MSEKTNHAALAHGTPSASYDVGYGKPPDYTKWKKGESGNPSGKRKGTKSFKKMLLDTAAKKITVQDAAGNQKSKQLVEIVVDAGFRHGIKGKTTVALEAAKLLQEFSPPDIPETVKAGEYVRHGNKIYQRILLTEDDMEKLEALRYLLPKPINGDAKLLDL